MPRTFLLPSSNSTAPTRRPGKAGVKLTDWVQVAPTVSAADAQVEEPPPAMKSSPGAPLVRTATLLTAPAAVAVTVTV